MIPKNVLITRNFSPVLLDFSKVRSSGCLYIDYAKMEVFLQFQIDSKVSDQFWSIYQQVYSQDPLILPRSNQGVARYIHLIRSTLWKACLHKSIGLSNDEIDMGYRAYLIFYLSRICAKAGNSEIARDKSYNEIKNLVDGI